MIKRASRKKCSLTQRNDASSLKIGGVPEKTGDAVNLQQSRTLKDRIPKCGLMVVAREMKTMGYIFHLKVVFYGSFLDSSGLACLQKKLDEI